MKSRTIIPCLLTLIAASLHAGSLDTSTMDTASTRYGIFGLLDHRSSYGQGVFPEPFLVDDSDLETNEARFDWLHTSAPGSRSDAFTLEVEKGFGLLTLELEVHFQSDISSEDRINGFGNVDLGARYPIFQYVSKNRFFDTTFGVDFEAGIPTNSPESQDAEFVPKIFNDLRIGQRLTLQSIVGFSQLTGSGNDDAGAQTLEYGFVLGYTISHKDLPLPGLQEIIPVFEVSGERQLNHDGAGDNSVTGNAALRFNMNAIGRVQPRIGVGYVFPLNNLARDDFHQGVIVSMVFEY